MHKNKVGTPNKVKGATTNRKNRVSNTKNCKPKLSAPSKKISTHTLWSNSGKTKKTNTKNTCGSQ